MGLSAREHRILTEIEHDPELDVLRGCSALSIR